MLKLPRWCSWFRAHAEIREEARSFWWPLLFKGEGFKWICKNKSVDLVWPAAVWSGKQLQVMFLMLVDKQRQLELFCSNNKHITETPFTDSRSFELWRTTHFCTFTPLDLFHISERLRPGTENQYSLQNCSPGWSCMSHDDPNILYIHPEIVWDKHHHEDQEASKQVWETIRIGYKKNKIQRTIINTWGTTAIQRRPFSKKRS